MCSLIEWVTLQRNLTIIFLEHFSSKQARDRILGGGDRLSCAPRVEVSSSSLAQVRLPSSGPFIGFGRACERVNE